MDARAGHMNRKPWMPLLVSMERMNSPSTWCQWAKSRDSGVRGSNPTNHQYARAKSGRRSNSRFSMWVDENSHPWSNGDICRYPHFSSVTASWTKKREGELTAAVHEFSIGHYASFIIFSIPILEYSPFQGDVSLHASSDAPLCRLLRMGF